MSTDSKTPRTDATYTEWLDGGAVAVAAALRTLCRQLERELAKARAGELKAITESQHLHHENIRLKDQLAEAKALHCDAIEGWKDAEERANTARAEALEEAAKVCEYVLKKHQIHSNFICASSIRALIKERAAPINVPAPGERKSGEIASPLNDSRTTDQRDRAGEEQVSTPAGDTKRAAPMVSGTASPSNRADTASALSAAAPTDNAAPGEE